MELLEQGWVGAEYFWYPARDRLYFTHAEVLKKPPDLTGRCRCHESGKHCAVVMFPAHGGIPWPFPSAVDLPL